MINVTKTFLPPRHELDKDLGKSINEHLDAQD